MKEEEKGIYHIILFSDFYSVYAFDPVRKSPIRRIIPGKININALAVDSKRKYLFINEYDRSAYSSKISMYKYSIDVNDTEDPNLIINFENVTVAYRGGLISAISVDETKGMLFISDASNQNISTLIYDPEQLKKSN